MLQSMSLMSTNGKQCYKAIVISFYLINKCFFSFKLLCTGEVLEDTACKNNQLSTSKLKNEHGECDNRFDIVLVQQLPWKWNSYIIFVISVVLWLTANIETYISKDSKNIWFCHILADLRKSQTDVKYNLRVPQNMACMHLTLTAVTVRVSLHLGI